MEPVEPAFYRRNSFPPPYSPNIKNLNPRLGWAWKDPPENNIFAEFYLNTSVHGLKYLAQPKRHIIERIFWLVAIVASTITAGFFIWGLWHNYKKSPIITVFHSSETKIDQISFPSVTICNMNGVRNSILEYFDTEFKDFDPFNFSAANWTEERINMFARLVDVTYICDSCRTTLGQFLDKHWDYLLQLQAQKEKAEKTFEWIAKELDPTGTLYYVSQPCENMLLGCIWKTKIINCSHIFQQIITDFGYCCTFNTIPMSLLLKDFDENDKENENIVNEWNLTESTMRLEYQDLLFSNSAEDANRSIPYRQKHSGRMAGLTMILNPDLHEYDHCSNTDSEGYIMRINSPLDFPRIKNAGVAIAIKSEVFVGIRPEITMSDRAIKRFPLETRECYYGNEFKLPHYKKYTLSNCMDECIARVLMEECGCVRYYMPRNHNDTAALCKPSQYKCADEHEDHIHMSGLQAMCPDCLPTCTEIEFRREVTTSNIQSERAKAFYTNYLKQNFTGNMSIVHVYFDTDSVYPRLRKQQMTYTDLISSAGGLLGLFMGFSVLSLLELVYYATMRPFCSYFRRKAVTKLKQRDVDKSDNSSLGGDTVDMRQPWFFKMLVNQSLGDEKLSMQNLEEENTVKQRFKGNDIFVTKLN